jgi:hypothetical protein
MTTDHSPVLVPAYDASRLNALQHGVLSQFTVLPWEDATEYADLLTALATEHAPTGPTEEHLVEELTGVLWRKRRLRLAEAATLHRGLHATKDAYRNTVGVAMVMRGTKSEKPKIEAAITTSAKSISAELADVEADHAKTISALAILQGDEPDAYARALETLKAETREAWTDQLAWPPEEYAEGDEPFKPDATHLARYLNDDIMPWYEAERERLEAMPMVRAQALGDAIDPDKLLSLGRYEVHLDRKFERTLSTLLRLQDLRRNRAPA